MHDATTSIGVNTCSFERARLLLPKALKNFLVTFLSPFAQVIPIKTEACKRHFVL